ncbi:hypothetical protein LL973_01990 [Xanthomonas campestris pv. nigromaculans]|nr:hypothetical protein [Xanthomonas campestris pv. nigromaculans]
MHRCRRTQLRRQALQHEALVPAGTHSQTASGKSREPMWPAQVIGNISHVARLAAAAVVRSGRWRGIDIDLEHVVGAYARNALRFCRSADRDHLPHLVSRTAMSSAQPRIADASIEIKSCRQSAAQI